MGFISNITLSTGHFYTTLIHLLRRRDSEPRWDKGHQPLTGGLVPTLERKSRDLSFSSIQKRVDPSPYDVSRYLNKKKFCLLTEVKINRNLFHCILASFLFSYYGFRSFFNFTGGYGVSFTDQNKISSFGSRPRFPSPWTSPRVHEKQKSSFGTKIYRN